jgi:hypothetical protein
MDGTFAIKIEGIQQVEDEKEAHDRGNLTLEN